MRLPSGVGAQAALHFFQLQKRRHGRSVLVWISNSRPVALSRPKSPLATARYGQRPATGPCAMKRSVLASPIVSPPFTASTQMCAAEGRSAAPRRPAAARSSERQPPRRCRRRTHRNVEHWSRAGRHVKSLLQCHESVAAGEALGQAGTAQAGAGGLAWAASAQVSRRYSRLCAKRRACSNCSRRPAGIDDLWRCPPPSVRT